MSTRRYEMPGRFDQVTGFLASHPGVTLSDLSRALGVTRTRALLCLRYGMQEGAVRREMGPARTWRWYVVDSRKLSG